MITKQELNWFVVYTKPKWEKKVAEQLEKIGVECYCPLIIKEKQWSDRKKKVEVPLFNSYVFVQLTEASRNLVFQSPGVVRYLFWLGKPAIVRDNEINTIKQWLDKPSSSDIVISNYNVGDKIKVESGPFLNQDAVIKEVNKNHFVLVLESLGCVLRMDI
ncbi:UpxY family transcription antiterminator [Flavobacterium algicola]|uniref:UpxY family transcription antiterminator n=1 Tax=Flavobacterium algicola TaxID=556529 RepID=UPI001EFCE267|nr:UpxY family transcription antiterminator [Flavobacterium algicola]MCG9793939.1 UpxY family transcription antiterminator [Flavobacterium algicola]